MRHVTIHKEPGRSRVEPNLPDLTLNRCIEYLTGRMAAV